MALPRVLFFPIKHAAEHAFKYLDELTDVRLINVDRLLTRPTRSTGTN